MVLYLETSFSKDFLHDAVRAGLCNLVKVTIEIGKLDVDLRYSGERAPLSFACEGGKLELVKLLLSFQSNINSLDSRNWTPLHYAAYQGHVEIVGYLLTNKADPHGLNNNHKTPLMEAADGLQRKSERNFLPIIKLLLKHGSSVETRDIWARNALCIAAQSRHAPSVVKLLIDAGSPLHVPECADTAFHISIAFGEDSEIFKILLKAERQLANSSKDLQRIAFATPDGNTPLHLVARGGLSTGMLDIILRFPGIDIDRPNLAGQPALQCALHQRGTHIVQALLDRGARTDMIDYHGCSLLDTALVTAPSKTVMLLVQRSCRANNPWDSNLPMIRKFANRIWFPSLLNLLPKDSREDPKAYGFHINQVRAEAVIVSQQSSKAVQEYLKVTLPAADTMKVRRIRYSIVSHDQGWSDDMDQSGGTYAGSHTWFEAQIRSAGPAPEAEAGTEPGAEDETKCPTLEIQRNITAFPHWIVHTLTWERDSRDPRVNEWMHLLAPGNTIVVLAKAQWSGWWNYVETVRIDVYGDI